MTKTSIYSNEPVLALGLQSLISGIEGFEEAAIYQLWEALLADAAHFGPDHLLIVDLAAAVTLEKLTILTKIAPGAKVILLARTVSVEFLSQAVPLGVCGILRKGAPAESWAECVRSVAAGKMWMDSVLAHRVHAVKRTHLTPRERELMGLLAQGLSNKELAWRMNLTVGTVKAYLTHLYDKVGASDRFDLALIALKNLGADQMDAFEEGNGAAESDRWIMPRSLSVDREKTRGERREPPPSAGRLDRGRGGGMDRAGNVGV